MAAAPPITFRPDELEACILSRERGLLKKIMEISGADLGTVKDYVQSVNIAVAQALRDYMKKLYPDVPRLTVWLAALKAAMKAGFGTFRCLVKRASEGDRIAAELLKPSPENAAKVAEIVARDALPVVFKLLKEYNGIRYPERLPEEYVRMAAEYAKAKNLRARKTRY